MYGVPSPGLHVAPWGAPFLGGAVRPLDFFAARRQVAAAEFVELERTPQGPSEPDIAEAHTALESDSSNAHMCMRKIACVLQKFGLIDAPTKEVARELAALSTCLRVPEIRNRNGTPAWTGLEIRPRFHAWIDTSRCGVG